jgi:hypothetical protein
MTEKQAERIQAKITTIKKELARDKKQWGGYYHDGRGYRYEPPQYYVQLGDFKGAMAYFRWFEKNFPDDIGVPGFLFEWTITLFKNGKIKDAENKAIQTFISNTYLIDGFLNRPLHPYDTLQNSAWQKTIVSHLPYSTVQPNLADFTTWLRTFVDSEKFKALSMEYIDIELQLLTEPVGSKRRELVERLRNLIKN